MGTNQGGINRYDGSGFSYIDTEHGLSNNVVYSIEEFGDQVLVGTNNGLSIVRGPAINVLGVKNGLPHPGVVSILVTSTDQIWLGTGKGVARLENDSIIPVILDTLLNQSTVLNIREGADGDVWFATVQNGLFRWNGSRIWNISVEDGLLNNYVFDVMPLEDGGAWLFSYKGLYVLDESGLNRKLLSGLVSDHTIFYGFTEDKAGNIWIGTSGGVLKFFDGEFTLLTKKNGLVNNNIWKILQDREGNLWFGSKSNGVSKLNSERFKIYSSSTVLRDPVVSAVYRTANGDMWLGNRRGVSIWDTSGCTFLTAEDGLSSEVVRDIEQSKDGSVYMATDYGLSVYKNGSVQPITVDQNDLNGCRDVFVDENDVWVGTKVGVALLAGDRLIQPNNAADFNDWVFDAVRYENALWFAYEDGVLRYDGKQFEQLTQDQGFFNGRARSIEVGPNGNLWFGTNEGVYMYNGDSCVNIGVDEGLISEAVYSLKFDKIGTLWVGQSKGLCRIYMENGSPKDVLRYAKAQGFLGLECSSNSIWVDEDGTVWVGATNGLVEYDPRQDKGLYFEPKTRITAVKIFSRETNWNEYSDSITTTGLPYNPELPFSKNHLTFEYSGVSLTVPISINYSYKLEGLDDNWSPVTNDDRAVYNNIPPGNYTFSVRAGFGDELWENEPVSISFTVLPPFYRTNWFYLTCALIAAFIAYSYIAIRRANTKITRQKSMIETQKEEIEMKNRHMLDSINYASTIQSATLPSDEQWFRHLPNSFVLYLPKDIVSGDFYWMAPVDDDVFFAAVDCTGHGVPGALISIIGHNGLNKAVKELGLRKPADILQELGETVNETLRKAEHDNYVRDGMDIALCKLNRKEMKLEFAGSVNPCVIVRDGAEIQLKGDRISIGMLESTNREFANHSIDLKKGDCIYVYSDGYADQFGGPLGKKMKTAVLRSKLCEVASLNSKDQRSALESFLYEWKGDQKQVDDICLIGVKV